MLLKRSPAGVAADVRSCADADVGAGADTDAIVGVGLVLELVSVLERVMVDSATTGLGHSKCGWVQLWGEGHIDYPSGKSISKSFKGLEVDQIVDRARH
mmetsp:Transcript_18977/g.57320  ORF Transcript_18977/g.57320 Transcript_18977/m.57320 type:complete len:99 (+) Transcript_18977:744-1040(+)